MNAKSFLQGELFNGKNIVETFESLIPIGERALKLIRLRPQRVVGALAVLPAVGLVGAGMVVGAGVMLALPSETTAKMRGSIVSLYRKYTGDISVSAPDPSGADESHADGADGDDGTVEALDGQERPKSHKSQKNASRDASYSARKSNGNHSASNTGASPSRA